MPVAKQTEPVHALVVSMRELARNAGEIVKRITDEKRPAIVRGRSGFAAIIQPLDAELIHQLVLDSASGLLATRKHSELALAQGKTMTALSLAEELNVDLAPTKPKREAKGTSRVVRAHASPTKAAAKAAKVAVRAGTKRSHR